MTLFATNTSDDLRTQAQRLFARKRMVAFGVPVLIVLYFVYVTFAFGVPELLRTANWENGKTLVRDSYSHKVHVVYDSRAGAFDFSVEGERKGDYPEGMLPDFVTPEGDGYLVDLGEGQVISVSGEGLMTWDIPGYGVVEAQPSNNGVDQSFPEGEMPAYINASKNRVTITRDEARVTITRSKTEIFKYETGWELFWFTMDSPFYGKSFGELIGLAFGGGERMVEGKSNLAAMVHDFWDNPMWRHGDVAWALYETVLMAFLGTFGAAIVALPLAFLAARNFSPIMAVRFAFRRVFDFLRGVDALIWTIVLARAFGPGPLTGALAILVTDTGSFGKMFSEALENVDEKQIEGIQSTGAKPLQRYRFGVIPQVAPVLLSQILYFFESNTRSATIIGAITGGGIGLLLTQAMITQKDWEEVTYYIILVVIVVILMDWLSGKLRSKLIKSDESGH